MPKEDRGIRPNTKSGGVPLELLVAACAMLLVCLDQFTKYLIVMHMTVGQSIPVIDRFFYITYVLNPGAAFGILGGRGQRWIFIAGTAVVLLAVLWVFVRRYFKKRLPVIALGLVLAGGVGNMIDRIGSKQVVDFLHFIFFGRSFYIFNVADCCVTVGAALLVIYLLFSGGKKSGPAIAADAADISGIPLSPAAEEKAAEKAASEPSALPHTDGDAPEESGAQETAEP